MKRMKEKKCLKHCKGKEESDEREQRQIKK